MPNSLVTRLTLVIAGVIAVAFAILVVIFHKSTKATFIETQIEVRQDVKLDSAQKDRLTQKFAHQIEVAFGQSGWSSITNLVDGFVEEASENATAFIVLNDELEVVAASLPELLSASVVLSPSGGINLSGEMVSVGEAFELRVSSHGLTELRKGSGETFGFLVGFPLPEEDRLSNQFALRVWRTAAVWLILTMILAMAATAIILRRSLRPIDQLTKASRELQQGIVPNELSYSGNKEYEQLVGAFNSATRTLARTDEIRKQLISDIAHELRTPLTNIKGQLEAVSSGLLILDMDVHATLLSESQLLERLIEDFQELAISDAGQLRINMQRIPFKEVCENILAPLAKHVSASLEICIDENVFVMADEERLKQVFGNLMENAIRHQPGNLAIRLTAVVDGPEVTARFCDNGSGISKEHQPFVFDRFYRAEKSRNRDTGGSGLGLAIVKAILEAMDGEICYVDSEQGARFDITLQIAELD